LDSFTLGQGYFLDCAGRKTLRSSQMLLGNNNEEILHYELDAPMFSRINSNRDRCQNSRSE